MHIISGRRRRKFFEGAILTSRFWKVFMRLGTSQRKTYWGGVFTQVVEGSRQVTILTWLACNTMCLNIELRALLGSVGGASFRLWDRLHGASFTGGRYFKPIIFVLLGWGGYDFFIMYPVSTVYETMVGNMITNTRVQACMLLPYWGPDWSAVRTSGCTGRVGEYQSWD